MKRIKADPIVTLFGNHYNSITSDSGAQMGYEEMKLRVLLRGRVCVSFWYYVKDKVIYFR